MGAPEARMWDALRLLKPLGFHFRRQVPLGPYFADFACHHAKLVIEIDGDTHGTDATISYDERRDEFIRGEGYDIVRVPNGEVMQNIDGVMTLVMLRLEGKPKSFERVAPPTLDPSPRGGGS